MVRVGPVKKIWMSLEDFVRVSSVDSRRGLSVWE